MKRCTEVYHVQRSYRTGGGREGSCRCISWRQKRAKSADAVRRSGSRYETDSLSKVTASTCLSECSSLSCLSFSSLLHNMFYIICPLCDAFLRYRGGGGSRVG